MKIVEFVDDTGKYLPGKPPPPKKPRGPVGRGPWDNDDKPDKIWIVTYRGSNGKIQEFPVFTPTLEQAWYEAESLLQEMEPGAKILEITDLDDENYKAPPVVKSSRWTIVADIENKIYTFVRELPSYIKTEYDAREHLERSYPNWKINSLKRVDGE